MERQENRSKWDFVGVDTFGGNILKDKEALVNYYVLELLTNTQEIFSYKDLPETIPKKEIEKYLQVGGYVIICKVNDKLYAFNGGLGGVPNEYYLPTEAIVTNPYLEFDKTLIIDKECVVIYNDSYCVGLLPIINKYAWLFAECDISMRYGAINNRVLKLLLAVNDNDETSFKKMMKDIEDGVKLAICKTNLSYDGLNSKIEDYATTNNNIKDIIELKQYLKGSFYNEIGLNADFNMKREAINESEADLNDDALLPKIDNYLESRRIGIDKVNKMFGTNISVDLSSSWKKIRDEIKLNEKLLKSKSNNDNVDKKESNEVKENETVES